jgi:two-component system cell cycle sensor histidine kinase/response regulator CckA
MDQLLVKLDEVIEDAAQVLRKLVAKTSDAELTVTHAGPLWVRVDPSLLSQAVLQLGINAAEAVGGGSIQVSTLVVRFESPFQPGHPAWSDSRIPPGTYALLTVWDDGPGVPPEVMPQMFEPFVTTKSLEAHRGLGLAVVHGIAKSCGWWVDVQSKPGDTTFSIYLPLARPPGA